jgi:hypothetical protein
MTGIRGMVLPAFGGWFCPRLPAFGGWFGVASRTLLRGETRGARADLFSTAFPGALYRISGCAFGSQVEPRLDLRFPYPEELIERRTEQHQRGGGGVFLDHLDRRAHERRGRGPAARRPRRDESLRLGPDYRNPTCALGPDYRNPTCAFTVIRRALWAPTTVIRRALYRNPTCALEPQVGL